MSEKKRPPISRKTLSIVCAFLVMNGVGLLAMYSMLKPTKGREEAAISEQFLYVVEDPGGKEIHPDDALIFEFSRSIIPDSLGTAGITTEPPVGGETTVTDGRTVMFKPAGSFAWGREYRAILPLTVRSVAGGKLEGPYEFEFKTERLKVLKVAQVDFGRGIDLTAIIQIDLNGNVDPSDLIRQLSIRDDLGNDIDIHRHGSAPARSVQIRTGSIRRDKVRVVLGGQRPTKKVDGLIAPFSTELEISREVKLLEARAEWHRSSSRILLKFNTPVKVSEAEKFITISPEVSFGVSGSYPGLCLEGKFVPGKRYSVVVKKALPAGNGSFVEKEIKRTVWFPDMPGNLKFKFPGHYLSSDGKGLIPVISTNIDSFALRAHRLYPGNLIQHINTSGMYGNSFLSKPLMNEEYEIMGGKNEEVETLLDLQDMLGDFNTGIVLLKIDYELPRSSSRYYRHQSARTLVVFSDIGISCRKSKDDVMVWINSLRTGGPLAEAVVECYSRKNQLVGSSITDAEGIATVLLGEMDAEDSLSFVLVSNGDDVSFHGLGSGSVGRAGTGSGRAYLSEGYEAFVTTERGMYRPGEVVHVETLVRDTGRRTPGEFPVDLVVYKPGRRELLRSRQVLDKQGGASFDIEIPRYEMSGEYRAVLVLPDSDSEIGSTPFTVADFMPRRIEASVEIQERRYRANEEIPFTVVAKHLFGAPAKGLRVKCRVLWRSVPFKPGDEELAKFKYGDGRIRAYRSSQSLSDSTTDEKGRAEFKITAKDVKAPSPLQVEIHPVVLEEGNRPTPVFETADVDVYDYYLGIKRAFDGTPAPGTEMRFDVVVLNPDGTLVEGKTKCEVELSRYVYSNIMKRVGEYYRYEWVREEMSEGKETIDLDGGRGTVSLKTSASGSHMAVISTTGGCAATLDFYAYAAGEDSFAVEGPEKLKIELDKEQYSVGDMVHAKINSTIKGRLLVTVETDRVLFRQTMEMNSRSALVDIPVVDSYVPNAYVTATVVRPTGDGSKWSAHRTAGVELLQVDNSNNKLVLKTEVPESVRPGAELSVKVNVTNEEEVRQDVRIFLVAVDEGVLQIDDFKTPDPFNFFYGIRSLGVRESDIYGELLPEVIKLLESSEPGGAGVDQAEFARRLSPIDAKRVKTVSLFTEPKFTDIEGNVTFSFKVPQYHGKLRVMALAADGALFGSDDREVVIKSPVMLECSFPRFLAPGDRCLVACTVRNKTESDGEARLEFYIEGPLSCDESIPILLDVKRGEDITKLVPFRAGDACGKAEITYSVVLGGESYHGSIELPVRPAKPVAHSFASGEVSAPGKTALSLGGDYYEGTESSSVTLAAFPWVGLSGCVSNLLKYPYGCVEQTVSRGVPLLYLPELVEILEPERMGEEEVEEIVNAVILRLRSMQTYRGGLAYWPGHSKPYEFGSAYAADFLLEADKAGYDVPEELISPLLDYLDKRLSVSNKAEKNRLGIKAYEAYVLSRAGRAPRQWLVRLEEQYEELRPTARCHLASALYIAGIRQDARDLLKHGLGTFREGRDSGGYLHSSVREKAIVLSTLLELLPEDPSIDKMARDLARALSNRKRSLTTQENAWALMSLAKYAKNYGETADWRCTVTLPDGERRELTSTESLTLEDIAGKEVIVELEGNGKLYYSTMSSGVPVVGAVEAAMEGIKVERSFYSVRTGSRIPGSRLKAGEAYYAVLTISTGADYENLVISDLLPGGLEIESVDQAFSPGKKIDRLSVIHSEKRDDRVVLFANSSSNWKPATYSYVVRAVTPGEYVLPALEAECMYDTGVFFVGEESSLQITTGK